MNIYTRTIKAVLSVRLASIETGDWRPWDPWFFEWNLTPKPAASVRSSLIASVVGMRLGGKVLAIAKVVFVFVATPPLHCVLDRQQKPEYKILSRPIKTPYAESVQKYLCILFTQIVNFRK
jgi:hypothetical protein